MLGAGIDPRMFVQDYSGFARAGAIQGQGMAQLGADIGDIGKQFGEFKKQQAEQEKQVKSAELVAKAISDSFPSLAPMAQEAMFILGDKNNPLSDRLAAAQAIETSLKIGSGLLAEQQNAQLASQKMAMQMEEQQRSANEIAGIENIYRGDEVVQMGRTRSGQLIPIGEMIQNALPQDETLQPLSDDLLTEADENGVPFEMGVSMGDEPGVLPPKPGAQLGVGPRYRESTQQQQEIVLLSPAQVQDIIAKGGKVSGDVLPDGGVSNAKVTYGQPQASRTTRFNPETGAFEIIEGELTQAQKREQKAEQSKKVSVDQNMMDLYFLEDRTKDMVEGVTGAAGRIVAERIPTTQQAENKAVIDRVSSRLTLGSLQAIREASPTGGSLGNVSDKDIQILKDSATSLKNAQSPAEFQRELIRLQNLQYETIYGDENFVKKELKEGRITQQEFDFIQSNRPQNFLDSRGQIRIRTTREPTQKPVTGLTEEEQNLLDRY